MKRICLVSFIIIVTGFLFSGLVNAEEWRLPLALTYTTGHEDVNEIIETNNSIGEGTTDSDSGYIPASISFQPYLQLDNGLRLGAGIGPVMATFGDVSFYDIPINLNAGYTFNPAANISPYFRAGLVNHILSGDYVKGSNPAFFMGIGVEFFRLRDIGLGVELAYDTSRLSVEKTTRTYYFDTLLQKDTSYISRGKEDVKVGWIFSIYTIF
ncbi:MAG: hypothetical protein JRC86_06090 [Deltaproteobacteria bacterium]|nr:hypothetical protein [Deltaproteobacteria bacterium]